MMSLSRVVPILLLGTVVAFSACAEKSGSVPEVPVDEITAEVAELDAVHDVMGPMWHTAFPAKDFEAIRAAVTDFGPLLAALDAVQLPGILQDKQARWDEQNALLTSSYDGLKAAAEAGSEDEMLAFAEAFHMNYEGMVRIIRPVVPELDVFHQALYGLYHYYGPGYDLEKITGAAEAMAVAVPPLQAAELPSRVAEHQADFEAGVTALGEEVAALQATLADPDRDTVEAAIEAVHAAYEHVEDIFG
jgi:hypothetical protein